MKLYILTFWSFILIFTFCDLGENVTNQFDEIDLYYQCNWYLFPLNIQRILPIIIINSQELVVLHAFGNVSCTREAFKKVILLLILNYFYYLFGNWFFEIIIYLKINWSVFFNFVCRLSTVDSLISWYFGDSVSEIWGVLYWSTLDAFKGDKREKSSKNPVVWGAFSNFQKLFNFARILRGGEKLFHFAGVFPAHIDFWSWPP